MQCADIICEVVYVAGIIVVTTARHHFGGKQINRVYHVFSVLGGIFDLFVQFLWVLHQAWNFILIGAWPLFLSKGHLHLSIRSVWECFKGALRPRPGQRRSWMHAQFLLISLKEEIQMYWCVVDICKYIVHLRWPFQTARPPLLKPLHNIGKTEKQKCSQIYT